MPAAHTITGTARYHFEDASTINLYIDASVTYQVPHGHMRETYIMLGISCQHKFMGMDEGMDAFERSMSDQYRPFGMSLDEVPFVLQVSGVPIESTTVPHVMEFLTISPFIPVFAQNLHLHLRMFSGIRKKAKQGRKWRMHTSAHTTSSTQSDVGSLHWSWTQTIQKAWMIFAHSYGI